MRRLGLFMAAAAIAISTSLAQGLAAPNSSNKTAGEESQNVANGQAWFTEQRLAPNAAVNNDAFASIAGQAASLPITAGAWTERTNPAGPGVDFSDPPQYIDPTSNFSNSGARHRWVAGR